MTFVTTLWLLMVISTANHKGYRQYRQQKSLLMLHLGKSSFDIEDKLTNDNLIRLVLFPKPIEGNFSPNTLVDTGP